MVNNKIIISIRDEFNNKNDLNSFTRIIKNQQYIIKNSELIVKKLVRKTSFLKPIKQDIFLSDNYLVMDIETKDINNEKVPYCVSIYDGEYKKSFYLLDYQTYEIMLEEAIKSLMIRKFDNYKIYLHNFSNFDGIFLLKILSNLSNNIRPTIRDGRLINIRFTYNNEYNLYFRDSYLILPSSLRKLVSSFNVESKGIFPYKFVNNEHIPLNYVGKFPRFTFFDYKDILENKVEYIKYKNSFNNKSWNLREETIKYCELDCVILYEILNKFSKEIFIKFRLDIHKYPTISSLAFAIYRSNFLKNEYNIPLIHGEIYDFIKQSYFGGRVDVFKPYGENIEGYDVNSLYPSQMKYFDMPVGAPAYFEGDITKLEPNAFGFFEVIATSPDNLNIPILQTKINNKIISPIGT
jgi:hypothetical protein